MLATIVVPPHLSVSGGARAGEQLSAALADRCDMYVADMMGDKAVAGPSTNLRRIPVRSWVPPLAPWSVLPNGYASLFYRSDLPAHVARGRFDLVHIHNPMPALEMRRVANACRRSAIPYVISTHGFNEVANGHRIYGFGPLKRMAWHALAAAPVARAVRGAAAIFALSAADEPLVREMGYEGEVAVVPNGVSMPDAGEGRDDGTALERLGIPTRAACDTVCCLFLANHTPNKGLPQLLRAFSRLEMDFLLVIAGERRSAIDYESHVRACRPGQKILVTGHVSQGEVRALLRRSDLFVFPTLADTFPLVVLEAMAHAVPVLASRVGGIPHQLDETCGSLVPPGDVDALAAAIATLAADRDRLRAMGRQAALRVRREFTWERAADRAWDGYSAVLARHCSTDPRRGPAEPTDAD